MAINRSPVIRTFEIYNLHGYKNVKIDFENSVKIVIAENGAGKTTILSALDAFLRGDFITLRHIQFDKISCLLSGSDIPLVLEKKSIITSTANPEGIQNFIKQIGADEATFAAYIMQEFNSGDMEAVRENRMLHEAYLRTNLTWTDIWNGCLEAARFYNSLLGEEAAETIRMLKNKLSGYEILYLPTYRRIEKPQKNRNTLAQVRNNSYRFKKSFSRSSSSINYGLEDVELRLAEISEEIQRKTNIGYRQISAKIIDDLVFNKLTEIGEQELPDIETLQIFFSRIGDSKFLNVENQKKIKEIYESPENKEADALRYFLGKLANVMEETSQLEMSVQTFVEKVNAYLGASSDAKTLIYDPSQMKVVVRNNWTNDEVKFDDLSSGEKQVISLLSYLFLFEGEKIVLIDEPELSLSIEWQQKILPDIASAPLCTQLLAITHSPFIFENELDPLASSLNITKIKKERHVDE